MNFDCAWASRQRVCTEVTTDEDDVDDVLVFFRDFDEETQKALEEIDANQNEIDLLNEKASEEILKVLPLLGSLWIYLSIKTMSR